MKRLQQGERYSAVAIAFHWTIAAMVVFNLAIGLLHESVPALKAWMNVHKSVGITVLALTAARIAWRLAHRPPPLPAHVPPAERLAAHATHWTLYALLLLMPITGWMMTSGPAAKRPLVWFGLVGVPRLPISAGASDAGHSAHGVLGWLMLALVVLHIGAALRHHLLLRDRVLARMAPALARD